MICSLPTSLLPLLRSFSGRAVLLETIFSFHLRYSFLLVLYLTTQEPRSVFLKQDFILPGLLSRFLLKPQDILILGFD